MLNYEIKLLKKEIEKHSEICIVIPTFKSKEVTLKTILLLISNNKSIPYDILLVDNEGFDYEYINQNVKNSKFQNLNYIVLQNNVGSAGAYYAGQKYAYDLEYKYFLLADNDANLIQNEGISMLINSLDQYDIVIPTNINNIQTDTEENTKINFEGELHFLALLKKTIEKLGFINKNYFFIMDDLDYIARANSLNLKVYRINECLYYHAYRKISLFNNLTVYFTIRNHFLFIFKNPNFVAIKYKFRSFKYLISYLLIKILHFLKLKDISLLKAIFLAFRDFCCNLITLKLPENNFEFIEVELTEKDQKNYFFDIDLDKNRILIKNKYFLKNKRDGLINYFELKRH